MDTNLFPAPGTSALRQGRRSEPGRSYLVTFACRDRRPLFADSDVAMAAARSLSEARLWRTSKLLCWVLMPDHWHGLVELSDTEAISTLVSRIKAVSARAINHAGRQRISVWASGFHERAVRRDEDRVAIARYIVRNPIRAGLCTRVGNYPFWDASWL